MGIDDKQKLPAENETLANLETGLDALLCFSQKSNDNQFYDIIKRCERRYFVNYLNTLSSMISLSTTNKYLVNKA